MVQDVVQYVAEKKRGHYNLRTSDQLLTFVYYTKHLHIFYLDDSNFFGSRTARRTAWVSARTTTRRTPCHCHLDVG